MSSNQITQARSMNGVLDFDGVENLNVDNIDAKNIDVENLEIETNLKVNNTDISPTELSFLNNTTSNIQTQLNNINTNISDNLVTKSGTQTITGDKTFSGTTTLTGDLNVNSKTLTPAEVGTLDGIDTTQTIQQQLDNAGISNAMTLNTQQVATGQKTFTQPIGIPALRRDDNTATILGYLTDATSLIYASISGSLSVANSTIIGEGVNSTIVSQSTRSGKSSGDLTLTENSPPSTSIQNVDGYLSTTLDLTGRDYVFEDVTNIQGVSGTTFFTGVKWNTTSSVTIPSYIDDFVLSKNNYDIKLVSNSDSSIQPNNTTNKGYIRDTNTFVQKPYTGGPVPPPIPVGDFLEGTGVIAPTKITARNNFSYTITSPNTITPTLPRGSISGYIDDTETIYYSSYFHSPLLNYQSFLKGVCSPETMILSAGTNRKNYIIRFNSVVSTPNYTKSGYILNASTIVFDNNYNLQLEQFVTNSNITKGKHYITALSNGVATLGDINTPLTPSTSTSIDGYLFTNNVLVGTGFTLNDFVTHPTDIPDIRTIVSIINPTFVNLSTSNNIPTPNNKTYNGFSPSATEFYYNDTNTNVAIDYYLKDNNIVTPTTNHLITAVDTTNKKLTTTNLPVETPSISVNGYTNINLNKIITETAQSVSVDDGIDTTLINTSTRFVSSVNGVEIGVSGTLNSVSRINDAIGFCNQSNQSIVYDPNTRLVVGNFLVDYDTTNIPVNSIITSITSLGSDIYNVGLSSSLTFTPSPETTITNVYKPSSNTLAVNSTTLNNKIYEKVPSGDYRYTTSQTTDNNIYNTNDTGSSDFYASASDLVVILTQTNEIFLLSTYNDSGVNFNTLTNKFIQENTLTPTECFLKTDNVITSTMNESIKVIQNLSSNFLPFNYGNANNSPYRIGEYSNEVAGNALLLQYKISGVIIYVHRKPSDYRESVYIPQTGDVILDCTGTSVGDNFKAKKSNFTGLYVDMGSYSGTAPILGDFNTQNVPVIKPGASTSVFLYAITSTTIFLFRQNSTSGKIIFYYHPINNSIQISMIKSIRNVVVGGTTYYEYTLLRAITADMNFTEFDTYPSWLDLYYTYGGYNTFSSAKLRPPSTLQYNFYNPNSIITIDNQAEYESITPTNVNIYSSLDSYNSYEKKTFQQIPSVQFELFNGTAFEEIEQVDFNSFEKLNFSIYNLETFVAQTSYDVTFPPNTNDEVLVLQDVFQILTNKYIRDLNVLDELRLDSVNSQMRISTNGLEILDFSIGLQNILYKLDGDGSKLELYGNATKNTGFKAGYMGLSNWSGFQHRDLSNYLDVAIMQNNSGRTIVNASSGQRIDFRINNADKFVVNEDIVSFSKKITSPNQPVWYYTGDPGNQNYGAGSRIGSYSYTGGQPVSRSFNAGYTYNTIHNAFNNQNGLFTASEGTGVYLIDLYVFCNNATGFTGRISLQTNAGRNQGGQYNMSVNRNTVIENCTNLTWTWTATSTSHYFYFYIHSSILTAFLGQGHSGLRVTKIL